MCDCYVHNCSRKNCKEGLDIHIADYCIPRKHLQIFCEKHLPKQNVIILTCKKDCEGLIFNYSVGERFAIRYIGEKMPAGYSLGETGGICPNTGNYWKEEILSNTKGIVDKKEIMKEREKQWEGMMKEEKKKEE